MVAALAGNATSGIFLEETAIVPYAIRSYVPIYRESTQVGVLSLASDIGTEDYVDNLHELSGMHFSLFKGDVYLMTSITDEDGNRIRGAKFIDLETAARVLVNGETVIYRSFILGEPSIKAFWPVKDVNGNNIGMWAIARSMSEQNAQTNRVLLLVIISSVAIMLILVLASVYMGRRIATPIRRVTDYAIQVAGGSLDAPLEVAAQDEVGLLVGSLNTMVATLKERIREADEANKAKSTFLSTMSHEIRTPMNAILGVSEIQLHNEDLFPDVREAFEKVYSSGDLLLNIINDILDLSKIEVGKLELVIGKYDIASLVSDTAQLNMMRIGSKQIAFELRVDETMPAQMSGDELRIKQILNNMLSNAFKYTDTGTVSLTVSASDGDIKEEVVLTFSVSDTGQGMTEEQIRHIFDEYSRFNPTTNRATEGSGLGMSITRNLIQLMGGDITIESAPGKGSTFTVNLPQGRVNTSALGKEMVDNLQQFRTSSRAQMRRVQISREPMPYGTVLIVDDVETNIYVAKGLLTPYSLKVDSADSGFTAIEKIKNGNVYDIVFMDHMMPGMDGVETTKRLRTLGYDHPIVALTANAVAGQADIFLSNGFDGFISKPIDLRQLNLLLNKMIRDKQTPEVIEAARQEALAKKEMAPKIRPAQGPEDREFVQVFIRDANKSLTALEELTAKSDFYEDSDELHRYIIHIHAIGRALANIGKMDLSSVAFKLEHAARDKITEIVVDETAKFFDSLRAFIEELVMEGSGSGAHIRTSALGREISGLDITRGLEQFDGDVNSYIQILRSYMDNVSSMLTSIETVDEKKLADYKITVHGIKGTSYFIFAEQVGQQAAALEKASAAGDLETVTKHHPAFLECAWKLIGDLNELIAAFDEENPRPKKDKPDVELLLKLRDACNRFDMDDVDAAMDEIEQYHYESDDGIAAWLRETVNRMDFSQVVEKLSNLEE